MPTITGQSIINRAAKAAGILAAGETLSGEDNADILEILNGMVDGWNNEKLIVYEVRDEQFTLPAGVNSRTVGSGGNFATTRPVNIEWVFIRDNDTDYHLSRMSSTQWAEVSNKAVASSWPGQWYYSGAHPLATIYFDCLASQSFEIHLGTWRQFAGFPAATDTAELPAGFKDALTYNLAIRAGIEYGLPVAPDIGTLARSTLAGIKRLRIGGINPRSEVAFLTSAGGFSGNILTGE